MGIEQFPQTPNFSGKEEKFGKKQKNNKISDEEIARLRQDEVGMNHEASTEGIVDYGKPSEVNIGDGKSQEKKKRKKREKYHVRSGGRLRVTQKHWDDFEKKIKQSRQEDVLDEQQEKEDKKSKNGLATSEERQAEIDRIWAEEKKEFKDDSEIMKEKSKDVDNFDAVSDKELERLKQGDLGQGTGEQSKSGNKEIAGATTETVKESDEKIESDFKEAEEEIEELSPQDKKAFLEGLANLGYKTTEIKSKVLSGFYKKLSRGTKKSRFVSTFFEKYSAIYEKRKDKAVSNQGIIGKGKMSRISGMGQGVGNLFKYGRVIYDIAGRGSLRRLNPFRHVTAVSMLLGRSAEAAKETRFEYEDVKNNTRVKDEDRAMEEAWKIYEQAKNDSHASEIKADDLEKAYKKNLPEDIKERFKRMDFAGTKFYQKFLEKDIKRCSDSLVGKIEKIEKDKKLSPEEKEKKKQEFLRRKEELLEDFDRMIGDQGTVDTIAYWSRMTEKVSKDVANILIIDSVRILAQEAWSMHHLFDRFVGEKAGTDGENHLKEKGPMGDFDIRYKDNDIEGIRESSQGGVKGFSPQTVEDKETAGSFARYQSDEEEMRGLPHGDLEKEIPQGKSAAGGLNETAKDKETAESFAHYESDEKEMNGLPDRADLEPEAVKSDVAGNLRVSSDGGLKEFEQAHNLLKQTGAEVKMDGGKISAVYEIGQKGDFKHLDQALRRIVVDKMDFGTDNKMDALEAARAENTLANLRQLIEGHNVAGMKSADFKGIVNFDEKTGQFRINDYAEFEKKLGSLIDHANANINANSDAVAYVDDTSHKAWQDMLDQKTAGKSRILADNFDNNKLVENAEQRISTQAKDFGNEGITDSKPGNTVNEFERRERNQLVPDDIDAVAAADKMGETIAKSAGPRDIDLNLEKPDIILGDNIKNYIDAHPEIMGDGSGRLNESNAEVVSKIVEQNPNINEHPEMLKTVLNNYNIIKNIPDPKLQTSMITLLYNPSRESVHELFKKAGVEIGGRLRDVTAFNRDGNLILHYDMKWAPDIDVIMDKSGKAYVDGPFGWNDSFKSLKNLKNVLMRPLELLGKMEKPINPGH